MSDHYRYDRRQVEALLPAVWDDEFGILAAKAEQEVRSNGDPAHGGGLMAMTADVRRAYASLTKDQHEMLHARHHYGLSIAAITELSGTESEQETAEILDLAVQDMIQFLGG